MTTDSWARRVATWTWIVVALGVAARAALYACNRSITADESFLYSNVQLPLAETFKSMRAMQAAPLGFLLIERVAFLALGGSEYALRLFPFVAGIVSLVWFRSAALRLLAPTTALMAVAVVAFSDDAILYASDFKQYSSDLCIASALLFLVARLDDRLPSRAELVALALAGVLALFFSQPACFVLASIGVAIGADALRRRNWRALVGLTVVAGTWLVAFGGSYFVSSRMSDVAGLRSFWTHDFLPIPPRSLAEGFWIFDHTFSALRNPVGISPGEIGAIVFVVGAAGLLRTRRRVGLLATVPFTAALLASAFHFYPFTVRLLVFAIPSVVLGVAYGTETIVRWCGGVRLPSARAALRVAAVGILLWRPIVAVSRSVVAPGPSSVEWRPVMDEVAKAARPFETVFLSSSLEDNGGFDYYRQRSGLERRGVVFRGLPTVDRIRSDWKVDIDVDDAAPVHRAWFLFPCRSRREVNVTSPRSDDSPDEDVSRVRDIVATLDRMGTRVASCSSHGVEAACFEFRSQRPPWVD
ncbi:MAG: hypothetical protein HYR85_18545 [Planctomycetes bacterium]|nr:hypothetical protein [Planctomycetota bacterium]MBI3843381.1 hypothetical protein [Planctomycetota bacterium]